MKNNIYDGKLRAGCVQNGNNCCCSEVLFQVEDQINESTMCGMMRAYIEERQCKGDEEVITLPPKNEVDLCYLVKLCARVYIKVTTAL